jgi:sec-independent protein translocase protein TatB
MFGIGMPEFILLMAIALIVIGPKKLPDLAKALGRALGEFKKATSDLKDSLDIDAPLSDVKRSFNDLNKNLTKDLYKKTLEDATPEKQAAPTAQVPPESGPDKSLNEADGRNSQAPDAQAREDEQRSPSGKETQASELPEKEKSDENIPEPKSSAAEPKPEPKVARHDKTDEARKA